MKNAVGSSRDFFSVDEIGRISEGFLGPAPASEKLRMLSLQNAWDRAVGSHLKAVARPSSVRGTRLTVEVRDQAWKRELDRYKQEILRRLAELLPSHPIVDIVFRVARGAGDHPVMMGMPGTLAPTRATPPAADQASSPVGRDARAAVADEMSGPLRSVPDAGLRERFSGVMGRYLARAR